MKHQAAGTAAAGTPAIEVEGVTRRFGSRWVLRGVDLRVDQGGVLALTGRNGSGKTTLLRILATLLQPSRGTVRIFGEDALTHPDAVRERLGFLAHNPGIYDDLNADENLAFAQRMSRQSADPARRAEVLARVGLVDAGRERVRGFSTGMRRRLALGRILLRPPTLLLLDEPYASFDADGIALVNEVARSVADAGGAVVIATHDLDRAAGIMDTRAEIDDGVLVAVPITARADAHRTVLLAGSGGV
ncbi:MAG: heme ABC exporter ATP-binding protein CcmA [Longimicrobiales bacterium]